MSKAFSSVVTAASAMITPIIPPGMGLILYAFSANVSVGRMFAAGYLPGILCMVFFIVLVDRISKKRGYKPSRQRMAAPKEILRLGVHALWALLMPLGIIMALRFGYFTATEAGAIACVYSLFIGVFVYHEFKKEHIIPVIKESVLGTATVMVIMCAANCLSYFLSYENIPRAMTNLIVDAGLGRFGFLIIVNIFILILGTLLAPIAASLGIAPIQFGIIVVFNVTLGNMTPPFGLVLYQVAGLTDLSVPKLAKACMPFIVAMLLVLLIITFCEPLAVLLPNLIYG